jgi:hypothetical protein
MPSKPYFLDRRGKVYFRGFIRQVFLTPLQHEQSFFGFRQIIRVFGIRKQMLHSPGGGNNPHAQINLL